MELNEYDIELIKEDEKEGIDYLKEIEQILSRVLSEIYDLEDDENDEEDIRSHIISITDGMFLADSYFSRYKYKNGFNDEE